MIKLPGTYGRIARQLKGQVVAFDEGHVAGFARGHGARALRNPWPDVFALASKMEGRVPMKGNVIMATGVETSTTPASSNQCAALNCKPGTVCKCAPLGGSMHCWCDATIKGLGGTQSGGGGLVNGRVAGKGGTHKTGLSRAARNRSKLRFGRMQRNFDALPPAVQSVARGDIGGHHHHGHGHHHHHGDPEWKAAGSCCESCFEGNGCEGGSDGSVGCGGCSSPGGVGCGCGGA